MCRSGKELGRILLCAVAALLIAESSFAAHRDLAPISDEVVQKLRLRERSDTRPGDYAAFDRHLRETTQLLDSLRDATRARRNGVASRAATGFDSENQRIDAKRRELDAYRAEVLSGFTARRQTLVSSNARGQIGRLDGVQKQVEERFQRFDRLLKAARDASSDTSRETAFDNVQRFLREMQARGPGREDRPDPKPQPMALLVPDAPARISPPSRSKPAYLTQGESSEQRPARALVAPSTAPQTMALASTSLQPVAPEAASCGYTAADLAADGIDVQLTDEMRNLAQQLNYSPARLYEYVLNRIRYEPYFGSLKGAVGTLHSGAGGATDQASLLISLLRASNIPARYVRGDVEVLDNTPAGSQGRAARWHQSMTAAAASGRLVSGRNPAATWFSDGLGIRLTQVWVEACVPYGNYRGSGRDASGHRWIPLDPSFKNYRFLQFSKTSLQFDYTAYLATRTDVLPHEAFENQIDQALGRSALDTLGYKSELVPQSIDVLPSSLPYEVFHFTNWSNSGTPETAVLPTTHRYYLNYSIQNEGGQSLAPALQVSVPEMLLKRITLSFRGATGTDQTALTAWRNAGSSASLPCDINAIPVMKIDGVDSMVGTQSVGICTRLNKLTTVVSLAEARGSPTISSGSKDISAADYEAEQLDAFQISDRLLSERSARLLASIRATSNPNTNLDETEGEFLHIVGMKWMRYQDDYIHRAGVLYGESGDGGIKLSRTFSTSKVEYLFDLPLAVSSKGFIVDGSYNEIRSRDLETGSSTYQLFFLGSHIGSAYEHFVWQEASRVDSISTVRGLQYANETGIPLLTIDSSNASTQIPLLTSNSDSTYNYSASQISSIQGLINAGATITVPRRTFLYGNWKGSVWRDTYSYGGAGMRISGSYNGGQTVGKPLSIVYNQDTNTGYVFQTPPGLVPMPDAVTAAYATINSQIGLGFTDSTVYYGDPVNVVNGNMFHTQRDIALKGRGGLPIVLERTYNSRDAVDGPLGYGWTHSLHHFLQFEDGNTDGQTTAVDTDGITSTATWVDGTGSRKFVSVSGGSGGVAIGAAFVAPIGSDFTTTRASDGTYRIREKSGITYVFENVAGTVGQRARLISIIDRNQNALALTYGANGLAAVTDALGRGLTFEYTSGNHISAVVDFTGRRYAFNYGPAGDLVEYLDPIALTGGHPSEKYDYYGAADGANLNHAMRKHTLPKGNSVTFEYYANGRVFRHYNSLGETTTFYYNEFRRETVTTNERGIRRQYFFDLNGNTVRVVEGDGTRETYVYGDTNPFNRTERVDSVGLRGQYSYDAAGNVTRVTSPSGNYVEHSFFDTYGQPGKVRDANGNYSIMRYDARGNLLERISFRAGVGATVTPASYTPVASDILSWSVNTYDAVGNLATSKQVRDFSTGAGPIVQYTYDTNLLSLVSVRRCGDRDGDGVIAQPAECDVSSLTHDSLGRLRVGVDHALYPVEYEYDLLDRIKRGTDGNGKLRDYFFDGNGNSTGQQLVVTTAGLRAKLDETVSTYDQSDRVATTRNSGGFVTSYQYDAAGNTVSITNPDKHRLGFEYDSRNRVIAAYDEEGHRAARRVDAAGRLLQLVDANGNVPTRHEYYGTERDGRLRRTYDAAGRFTELDYDNNGNVVTTTDNLGRTTRTEYDALDRPVRIVGSRLSTSNTRPVTRYFYDGLSRRIRVEAGSTDASGINSASDSLAVQATYVYDDFGRKLRETDALGRAWRFTYDSHGNLQSSTDARNKLTQYTYQYGGRMLTRQDHDGAVTSFSYDDVGQMLTAASPEVSYSYQYDAGHRLTQVTDSRGAKSLRFGYSPGGLLNSVLDSEGHRTDYLYDPVGRLSSIWGSNGDQVTYAYDDRGRLLEKRFANGASTRYRYNTDDSIASLINAVGSTRISEHTYTYDGAKRRETATDSIGASTAAFRYVYDEQNRLAEVRDAGTQAVLEGLSYDIFGNRLTRATGGSTQAYVYDAAHQLQSIRDGNVSGPVFASFQYDANGNITQKTVGSTTTTLLYDALNRVSQVSRTGSGTQTYAYDHSGRRIRKSNGSDTVNYLYNGPDIFAEYGPDWAGAKATYLHGPQWDDAIARTAAGKTSYYHRDGLNSVVAMTSSAGALTATARYDSWGNVTSSSGTVVQYGYAGREPDETGLMYYRARYYDPSIGRFTQMDPAGFIDGINRYAYAANNPVNFIDPLGLSISSPLAGNTGSYFGRSMEQLFLGSYSNEVTGLGTGLQIFTGLIDLDLPGDVRDLFYDATHFEASWSYAGNTGLDIVGLVPLIGALKYADEADSLLKHSDDVPSRPHGGSGDGGGSGGGGGSDRLPDDALVCRGGTCKPEQFTNGTGVTTNADGTLNNVSVNSGPGLTVNDLTRTIDNGQVGVTTVGDIRRAGGDVFKDGNVRNPTHCLMCGITAEQANKLFTPTVPNPNKRKP